MPSRESSRESSVDPVVNAVQVARIATGECEAPASSKTKPTASPEAQAQIAAITAELAAAGVTIRWR